MNKVLMSLLVSIVCGSLVQAQDSGDSMKQWTANYKKMVRLLNKSTSVGNCGISLSQDPNSPKDSHEVNILPSAGQGSLSSFSIVPPLATNGETQVTIEPGHVMKYRQSDMVGWTNLFLQLDAKEQSVEGLTMNKTLPSGEVYSTGSSCGSVPQQQAP